MNDRIDPMRDRTVPINDRIVPMDDRTVPMRDRTVPIVDRIVPMNDRIVPFTHRSRAMVGRALPFLSRGRALRPWPDPLRIHMKTTTERTNEEKEKNTMATTKITRMTSPHVDEAKVFLDKIRTLRGEIPRLVPEVPSDTKKLVPVAKLSDKFLESASVALQVSARLEQACGVDATTLRDSFGYALAYSAVVQEFRALSRAMAHTIRVQRAEAAQSALDVYAFAQRLSAQKDGAELLPYVEDMRKKLNSGRTRKASSKPDSKPPAPPTPPITKV